MTDGENNRNGLFVALNQYKHLLNILDIQNVFLRFMYGQNVMITMENVDGVLYAAEKYDLGSLKEKCDSFLSNECGKSGNALRAFEIAHKYSLVELSKISLELVGQNANEYFTSTEFTELTREAMHALLEYDDVVLSEIEIYRAALRWAEAECYRKSLSV